jgi:hypothetical protein
MVIVKLTGRAGVGNEIGEAHFEGLVVTRSNEE